MFRLKQSINIRYFMVAYLALLFVVSALAPRQPDSFRRLMWDGLVILFCYSTFDLLWTRLRDRVWYVPLSSWISGLVLANVAFLDLPFIFLVLLPLVAVLSKQLLHFGKSRHLFNPAAFSMALLGLFAPTVAWGSASWGIVPLAIVTLFGLVIVWRQERWHVVLPFLFIYEAFRLASLWGSGLGFDRFGSFLLATGGVTIFFATVMLIEPVTSGFATKGQRIIYGCLVGVVAGLVTWLIPFVSMLTIDPLLAGLLTGNLVAGLAFLPKQLSTPSV